MITSWNKIDMNIGDLFLFLVFDTEKLHPPPPRDAMFALDLQNIYIFSFLFIWVSVCLLFHVYTQWQLIIIVISGPKLGRTLVLISSWSPDVSTH